MRMKMWSALRHHDNSDLGAAKSESGSYRMVQGVKPWPLIRILASTKSESESYRMIQGA